MRWSAARVVGGVALGAWAAAFWFLLLTGRSWLYVSSRTFWVVPLGAVVLSIAAVGRLLTARTAIHEPLPRRDAWMAGFVVLPVVAVLVLPPANLGSYAAGQRAGAGAGLVGVAPEVGTGEVTLVEVAGATWSDEGMEALIQRAGSRVSFVGIVTRREGMPADEFMLTRFIISCCVADALSVQVRVVGAPVGRFEQDQWVRVEGTLYPLGTEVLVKASEIEAVPRPAQPYLNP